MTEQLGTDMCVPLDTARLLHTLDAVADEGWDGPCATAFLRAVREQIARPLAVAAGLRGLAASQAEASAWQAAWEVVAHQDLRQLERPMGVVLRAAQRAVGGEAVAARYGTDVRTSWRLYRAGVPGLSPIPSSFDRKVQHVEDDAPDVAGALAMSLSDAYRAAADALRDVGWPTNVADSVVALVAKLPDPADDPRCTSVGWRNMAAELLIPPWQARRVCVALLGTTTWVGLLGRLLLNGADAIRTTAMRAALQSTRRRALLSPVLAAARAGDGFAPSRPQQMAS